MNREIFVKYNNQLQRNKNQGSYPYLIVTVGSTAVVEGWKIKEVLNNRGLSSLRNVRYISMDVAPQQGTHFREGDEFLRLHLDDVEGLVKNIKLQPRLLRQLPGLKAVEAISSIQNGVEGEPIFAALALLYNTWIEGKLTQAITDLFSNVNEVRNRNELRVIIILSPLGGVAPGTAAYISYLIQSLCRDLGINPAIWGFVILPVQGEQVKSSIQERLKQIRNFYFTTSFIETLMSPFTTFTCEFTLGRRIETNRPIFDLCFIHGAKQGGEVASDLSRVIESLAQIIGNFISGGLDNTFSSRIADHMMLINSRVHGRSRRCLMSSSTALMFPAVQIFHYCVIKSSKKRVEKLLTSLSKESDKMEKNDLRKAEEEIKRTIEIAGLKKEVLVQTLAEVFTTIKDDVPPKLFDMNIDLPSRLEDWWTNRVQELNALNRDILVKRINLTKDLYIKIDERFLAVEEEIHADRAYPGCIKTLLINRLKKDVKELKGFEESKIIEIEDYRKKAKEAIRKLKKYIASRRRVILPMGKWLGEAIDATKGGTRSMREIRLYREINALLTDLIQRLERRRFVLERIFLEIQEAVNELSVNLKGSIPADSSGFIKSLVQKEEFNFFYEDICSPLEIEDVIKELQKELGPMGDWKNKGTEEIIDKLFTIEARPFKKILDLTVVDILAGEILPRKIDIGEEITTLKEKLQPTAGYSMIKIPNEDSLPSIEMVSFAKSNASDKANEVLLKTLQNKGFRTNCIHQHGHPYYLIGFSNLMGLPFGALKGMERWQRAYQDALKDGADTMKIFDGLRLQDPMIPDDEYILKRMRSFVKSGIERKIIQKSGSSYYFGEMNLGCSPDDIQAYFLQHSDLCEKIAGEIYLDLAKDLSKKVPEKKDEWWENVSKNLDSNDPILLREIRSEVEERLKDLNMEKANVG